jgi:hypothetical protein
MAKRSSASYYSNQAFNPMQIKDGRIVRLRKDGSIKADLGPYLNKSQKKTVNGQHILSK